MKDEPTIDTIKIPDEPGFYHDLPFDVYAQIRAMSQSKAKLALPPGTLADLEAELLKPDERETRWMNLGTICHAGAFEPLTMLERFAVMPAFEQDEENVTAKGERTSSKATNYYKNKVAEWMHLNEGKTAVDQSVYDAYRKMMVALNRSKRARDVMTDGAPEVSIVWQDKTGVLCKGRIDCLRDSVKRFTDYKTSRDVTRPGNVIAHLGYDFQLAFYRRGLRQLTGEDWGADLVMQKNHGSFVVRAAPVSDDDLNAMDDRIEELLPRIAQAQRSGFWPGYEDDEVFAVPEWRLQQANSEPLELTIDGATVEV